MKNKYNEHNVRCEASMGGLDLGEGPLHQITEHKEPLVNF